MFFDDFEPLEDIEPSKTKNEPPQTQKDQKSPAKEQKSFGVDMDDFAEFQAGARDHDDDQSSVYTEDYMGGFGANDSVNKSGEDLDYEGDEYEETWKNNTVNLAKSSTKQPAGQNKDDKILNDFYGGAQAGFLFDNYVLDDNQRRMEEPSPIYITSAAKLSDRSANSFGMRDDKEEEHRMTPESKEQFQYLEQEPQKEVSPPARPTAEFKQAHSVEIEQPAASKSGFGSSDFGQGESEQQIESKGTVEEEQQVQVQVQAQEKVPEKPQENQAVEEMEGLDQFQDADNFHGIQEGDFASFVENDDNYSQGDSKYEGSFVSEKDFSQPNSARPDSQVAGGSKILEELEPYPENHHDESHPYMNQPSYGSSSEVPKSQKTIDSNSDIFDLKAERTPQNVQNEIVHHHQQQPVANAWDMQPEIESATSERMERNQNIPPSSASVEQKQISPQSVENYPNYFDDEQSSQPTPQHQNKQLVDELENNFDFIPGRPAIKRSSTQEIKRADSIPKVEEQPLARHQSLVTQKPESPAAVKVQTRVEPEPILEVKNYKSTQEPPKIREPLFKRPSLEEQKPPQEPQAQIQPQPQSKPIQKEPPPQKQQPPAVQNKVVTSPTELQRSSSSQQNNPMASSQQSNVMTSSQRKNTLGFSRPGAESMTTTIENSSQRYHKTNEIRTAETKKPYPNLQDSAVNTDISRDFDIEPRELKKPQPQPEQRTPVKKPVVLTQEAVKPVVYTPVEKKTYEPPVQAREVVEIGQPKKSAQRPQPESPKQVKSQNTIVESSKPITPIQSKGTTPRGGFAVQIRCASHPSEYIEKVCVDPKYHGKKLLCFECGVEESREMQKYKVTTQPITQFLVDKIQQYQEVDPNVSVPEEYLYSLRKLQSTEERFSANISDDVTYIKKSLHDIKSDLLAKFDEIENTLDELSQYKLTKFSANREFFEKTLNNQYASSSSGSSSTQKIPHQDLIVQVSSLETEADFDNFLRSLKLEKNPDSPEVKNYLKVLSHKANNLSNATKFPNKSLFKDLKSKNVNISQLQEQLVINLTSVKTTIYELLDSSYTVEDISKTRVMPSNTLTADNSNILFPLNRIADGSVRYRLNLDKKFVEPESKIITCMTIIDNEILAAGTAQKSITFWSLSNSEFLESIQAHDSSVSGLYPFKASFPDLRDRKPHSTMFKEDMVTLLISTGAQDAPILFWDISWMHDYLHGRITEKQQSRLIRKLEGHKNGVTAMLPLSDGVTLVNGTSDGRICVWNVLKNKLGGQIRQHKEMITSLKILRCEQRFASASSDQTICIWKMAYKQLADPERRNQTSRKIFAGFELEKILDPGFKILCLGSSLINKNWLAFGGSIDRLVIWDIETGQLVKEFECDNNELVDLAWIEDESSHKMILFGICNQDDVIRAWDTDYKHTNYLLDEVYNLKHRQNIYINKTSTNGSVLQLVQDGIVKIAAINSEKNKSCVSLWEVELGI